MKPWTDNIDPSTIPDPVLKSEWARRSSLKRTTFAGGRPRVLKRCAKCGAEMGAREFRAHRCS